MKQTTQVDAVERLDSQIHAFVYIDREADWSGDTVAVKDSIEVAGMPWTYATAAWRDRMGEHDDPSVGRLRGAGYTIVGKTNLPELAAAIGTTNTMFPHTHNPWRLGYTPGGSTGGSAAALAAGMAKVGIGTDMGGSIRIPASCCGIVGLRPSVNRVPTTEIDAAGLSVTAPMARTVAELRRAFATVVAEGPPKKASRKSRIGFVDETRLGVDRACRDAVQRAADALSSAGHEVTHIEWESEDVAVGYGRVRRASMASFPADLEQFGPGIRNLVAEGRKLSAQDFFGAYEQAAALAYSVVNAPLLYDFDFLLTPTLGMPPMKIEEVPAFLSVPYRSYIQFVLPVSFAKVPAISIPAGLHDGLPVGVQLVGQFAREFELLDFAEELEAADGFGYRKPPNHLEEAG